MAAETLNITILRGDTWPGFSQGELLVNDEPLDLCGATALMQFRRSPGDITVAKEFSTGEGGGITITDGPAGLFSIGPSTFEMPPTTYYFDLQFTLATGRVLTPVAGVLTLLPDVSR